MTTQPTPVTFEDGYRELQQIAERVNSEEVPVHEMCDLFARGKGLEQALSTYLAEQRARVESIERGEGIQAFRVVAPGGAASAEAAGANGAEAAGANGAGASEQPTLGDDEIPF